MRNVLIMVAVLTVGCGASSMAHTATPRTEAYSAGNPCNALPAHVTLAQHGNRPIVADGITYYCF